MKKRNSRPQTEHTLGLIHLGCPKNQVDSEEMLAVLAQDGWTLVGDPDDAEVLVVNTCGFIDAAKEESLQVIRDAIGKKQHGQLKKVVVAGCLAQRYADKLAEEFPGVDAVVGLGHTADMADVVRSTFRGERPVISTPPPPEWQEIGARLMTTPPWTTYLKIGEGCDHNCSFCAIPSFRGKWRSRPAYLLLDEVRMLAGQGLKEVVLVGQDTTLYGHESRGQWSLARLIREIGAIEGVRWQRLMYAHPGRVDAETIRLFGDVANLAPYIDMPFQHGDDGVLKRMRRAGNTGRYLEVIAHLRERVPGIAIRSTFLVGFPGETDQEFEKLCEFVRQAQTDHAGVFVYSHEDGTPAYELKNNIPRAVAQERAAALMDIQSQISSTRLGRLVGTEVEALVEAPMGMGRWLARSERDAPEVDGTVTLLARKATAGELMRVKITESSTHDLTARPADLGRGSAAHPIALLAGRPSRSNSPTPMTTV